MTRRRTVSSVVIWDGTSPAMATSLDGQLGIPSRLIGLDFNPTTNGYTRIIVNPDRLAVSGHSVEYYDTDRRTQQTRRTTRRWTHESYQMSRNVRIQWNATRLMAMIPIRGSESYLLTDPYDRKRFIERIDRTRKEIVHELEQLVDEVEDPDWEMFEQTLVTLDGQVYLQLATDIEDIPSDEITSHMRSKSLPVDTLGGKLPSPRRLF